MRGSQALSKRWLDSIPDQVNESEVEYVLQKKQVSWKHVQALKDLSQYNDEVLAGWLNLSVRTFRDYRKPATILKENVREQVILLLTLIKHGIKVFGSASDFYTWLHTRNFYFNNQLPAGFLNMVTGIRFVDERLTAMEFGDNV